MDSYLYNDYTTTTATMSIDSSALIGIMLGFLVFSLVFYIIIAIFLSKIFKKLGTEPSWAAWVPVFNMWKFLEAGGQQGWWMFVPVAGVIFQVIAAHNIGLKFGKSSGWVALYIFLAPIWLILLGLDKNQAVDNPQQMNITGTYPQPQAFGTAQPAQPVQPMQQPYPQQPATPPFQQPQPTMPVQPVKAPQPPQQPTDQPPQV